MIGCVAVNDAFVMNAWASDLGVGDKITMLSDPQGSFVKSLGLDFDASGNISWYSLQQYSWIAC